MALFKIKNNEIQPIQRTTFSDQNIYERNNLQEMLKKQIEIISPDTLIVSEEFSYWEDSRKRIDLLGIDKNANLIVIELKRTEDGRHMELQAIRYASMVSTLTFEKLEKIYSIYIEKNDLQINARESLLKFLDWDEPNEDGFAQEVKIVLASAEFSKELTTSVMWLNEAGLDIRCVRMNPYTDNNETFLDINTVIPIPEASDYQIQIREKKQKEKASRSNSRDTSRINIYYQNHLACESIKKADIALKTVLLLQEKNLINTEVLEFLKNDRTCRFDLLKTQDQVTENEEKYGKYRISSDPEFVYANTDYYIAMNWGREGCERFKTKIEEYFPDLKFEFVE